MVQNGLTTWRTDVQKEDVTESFAGRRQMKAFYQNLWTLPPAEALRQAQLETIRTLRRDLGVANPGLWAPFILQGNQAVIR
jgi:CHAT domain-containing protein